MRSKVVNDDGNERNTLTFAPVSVLPKYQRQCAGGEIFVAGERSEWRERGLAVVSERMLLPVRTMQPAQTTLPARTVPPTQTMQPVRTTPPAQMTFQPQTELNTANIFKLTVNRASRSNSTVPQNLHRAEPFNHFTIAMACGHRRVAGVSNIRLSGVPPLHQTSGRAGNRQRFNRIVYRRTRNRRRSARNNAALLQRVKVADDDGIFQAAAAAARRRLRRG